MLSPWRPPFEGDTIVTVRNCPDRITQPRRPNKKMGVTATETPDGLIIQGSRDRRFRGASCTSHGDHRVAMSLAIAGLIADAPSRIEETACIETSFPGFDDKVSELLTKH
jgi:3-phosphoshikimate 1-carboxyvinyltransferase